MHPASCVRVEFHLDAFQIRNIWLLYYTNVESVLFSETYLMKEYIMEKKKLKPPWVLIALVHLMPQQQRLDAEPFEEHFPVKKEC